MNRYEIVLREYEKNKGKIKEKFFVERCDEIAEKIRKGEQIIERELNYLHRFSCQENFSIANDIDGRINNPACYIKIDMQKIPENCYECPMCVREYDEDGCFMDNVRKRCFFGCDMYGMAVERPKDCPIVVCKKEKVK